MGYEPLHHATPPAPPRRDDWWRGAVIYQIYPRSFQDSNGDGIGDLKGITARLDHVAGLGVDAVWISPIFKSPMKDFGYDVADYCAIDPIFGTLKDFDALRERAHALGLKVLLDLVPAHTSSEHPWFKESRASRDNLRADWYVWADARPDGSPPNNWLSVFGGVSWQWEQRRRQYYLHNFLKEQPQLNLHNPEVVEALLAAAQFWLERGVDGFRVDAVDWSVHDPKLRDNPPRRRAGVSSGSAAGSPFEMQLQRYNKARPELAELLLKPLNALTERYGGRMLLGEISGEHALRRAADYTSGGGLDMVYTFDLLTCPFTPGALRAVGRTLGRSIENGWFCWSFANHDVRRPPSRFAGSEAPEGLRRLVPVLLCTLRGTLSIYQGEELGLEEAELAHGELRDPFGIEFWPAFKGRDGARTPMPWHHAQPHGGFSTAKPWLPLYRPHLVRAVDLQEQDPQSVLNTLRRFLAWRRQEPALRRGSMSFPRAGEKLLVVRREHEGREILAAFNMSGEPCVWQAPAAAVPAFACGGHDQRGRRFTLEPWSAVFLAHAA
ncbi:alpha-amylase family glycosyl hydrolase [Geminicoccaceae bacterium 1502E]|nr:alpha-amylase family glycosyl hydrolase [Geminicoccaceae bacterium 1502E]